ncbi:MAG: DUF483 domain-containing protein [bacterium]|nr:DUF483 domain-containing protein [bacterium]
MPDQGQVTGFLEEAGLSERTKLEDYLLVALGVRPLGLLTYPAEFPDAAELGRRIDARFAGRYFGAGDPELPVWTNFGNRLRYSLLRAVRSPVEYKTVLLREVVNAVLAGSAAYQASREWARRWGLHTREEEVRPSIRELYLVAPGPTAERLASLMELRERIRQEARAAFSPGIPPVLYIYPEERSADYVRGMGALLGYPECCVEAYYRARMRPPGDPGAVASEQLSEAGDGVDPLAYFVRDFYPCRPACPEAIEVGRRALTRLSGLDPRLPDRYLSLAGSNRDRLRAYPSGPPGGLP